MERKKKILLGAGIGLAAAVCAAGILLWPTIQQAASVAESASMDEEAVQAKVEENARIEAEVKERYNIPDLQVSGDISAALADGSTTLEEAAAMLLEQSGGVLPGLDNAGSGETGTASGDTAAQTPSEAQVPWPDLQMPERQTPAPQTQQEPEQAPAPQTQQEPEPQSPASQTQQEPAEQAQTPAPQAQQEPEQAPQVQEPETQPASGQDAQEQEQSENEKKVQNLIAQAYVLRSTFTGRLDAVMQECISEYLALDESEQTTANKIRIVSARLKTVSAMEKECDAQVASLVSQLRELDPEAADQMEQQYQNEKAVKKAELIARYK